jgi:hypothetical protein
MTITTQKSTESRWDQLRLRFSQLMRRVFTVFNVGLILLILSFISGFIGYRHAHGSIPFSWQQFWTDYYANISAEFGSVAVTVLIIDQLNRRRQREEEKQRLIRQMGSKENGLALQAVEELRALEALKDGSLVSINLEEANLHGVRLGRVNMRGARMDFSNFSEAQLYFANLERADMSGINFESAVLTGANIRHANLVAANLEGALLSEADLSHAMLDQARFNDKTKLPDNTTWRKGTDLKRFTDPAHPDFWRSTMPESPAYDRHR